MVCLVAALSGQNKHEVRAVWLTTIGGIDWPRSYAHDGMGIRQQQEQLCHILDRLKAVNVNTVLLQTRVRATTIYPSDIEPWDGCLSGKPASHPAMMRCSLPLTNVISGAWSYTPGWSPFP